MNWGVFWDAFTAVGTVAMAVTTGLVIRQNRKYHRDASRPICVLVPDEGQDAVARRGIVDCHEGPNSSAKYFRVKASVVDPEKPIKAA